jgi:predicted homoserine dehydrogenase-like protein
MIIVDRALAQREIDGNPIRVGMVGAGAMGRMIALQIVTVVPGMELVGVANRTVATARQSLLEAGIAAEDIVEVETDGQAAAAVELGQRLVTGDPMLLTRMDGIDAIFEVTGAPEFAAHVVTDAIANGKHVATMNAELQGTVGPVLRLRALEAGVVLTDSDGDQPGVMMNLHRFVSGLGVRPVLLGNIKGLHDPYRNPTTQEAFARNARVSPQMATSFADGTKMSLEMALVANATGLRAGRLGMYGPDAETVHEAQELYPLDQLLEVGLVDYLVGAEPAPGVFCLGTVEHPAQKHWLKGTYKLGEGPLYTFYTPYHLCHLEAPHSVARAVLFGDAAVSPEIGHVLDVVAAAKRDLRAGEVLDTIGGYTFYGLAENADVAVPAQYLPVGLAEGCELLRDVAKDELITYRDVRVPEGRLIDQLRAEQLRVCPPVQRSATALASVDAPQR